jgi:hypothetical protein
MDGEHSLSELYGSDMSRVIYMAKQLKEQLLCLDAQLFYYLEDVPFETLFAGVWMTFFANLGDIETAQNILDRVVLHRSSCLVQITARVMKRMKSKIMTSKDVHGYLVASMFKDAVREGLFYDVY